MPPQAATATQIAEAVRIGPYLMPRLTAARLSKAQLNPTIAYVLTRASRRSQRLGDSATSARSRGPRDVVHRRAAIDQYLHAPGTMGHS